MELRIPHFAGANEAEESVDSESISRRRGEALSDSLDSRLSSLVAVLWQCGTRKLGDLKFPLEICRNDFGCAALSDELWELLQCSV